MATEFEVYKKDAMQAATDLKYGHKVVTKTASAKNEAEVCRIMYNARNEKIKRQEMYGGNV